MGKLTERLNGGHLHLDAFHFSLLGQTDQLELARHRLQMDGGQLVPGLKKTFHYCRTRKYACSIELFL